MNKKIKLIELFQKSANKEELPKKIYFDGITFELDKDGTYKGDEDLLVDSINFNLSNLNDYVEILEDNTKEIEAIELFINDFDIITDCLYDSDLKLSKSDEYYRALLLIQGILEDIYIEERRLLNDI